MGTALQYKKQQPISGQSGGGGICLISTFITSSRVHREAAADFGMIFKASSLSKSFTPTEMYYDKPSRHF